MAADPETHSRTHVAVPQVKPPVAKRKSCSHFLCKPLLLLCILIAIPSFPSKAPEFINHTILAKFWELFYLSFIGIAVCYGVFSRRNADPQFEVHPNLAEESEMYLGNLFGPDEKKEAQPWNSQYVRSNRDSGIESIQSVSAASANAASSSIAGSNAPESINCSGFRLGYEGSSDSFGCNENSNFVGELGRDERYLKSTVSPSPVPWHLRVGRRGVREEVEAVKTSSEAIPFSLEQCQSEMPQWSLPSSSSSMGIKQGRSSVTPSGSTGFPEEIRFEGFGESQSFYSLKPESFTTHLVGEIGLESLESQPVRSTSSFPINSLVTSSQSELSSYSLVSFESQSSVIEELDRKGPSPFFVTSEMRSPVVGFADRESCSYSLVTPELSKPKLEELEEESQSFSGNPQLNYFRTEEPGIGKTGHDASAILALSALPNSTDENNFTKFSQHSLHSQSETDVPSSSKDSSDYLVRSQGEGMLGNEEPDPGSVTSKMKPGSPHEVLLRDKPVRRTRRRRDATARKTRDMCTDSSDLVYAKTSIEADIELMRIIDSEIEGSSKKITDKPSLEVVKAEEKFEDQVNIMIPEGNDKVEAESVEKVERKSARIVKLSVRTKKQNMNIADLEARDICQDIKSDIVRKRCNKGEARKGGRRSRRNDQQSVSRESQNSDIAMIEPKQTVFKYLNGRENGPLESISGSDNSRNDKTRPSSNVQEDDLAPVSGGKNNSEIATDEPKQTFLLTYQDENNRGSIESGAGSNSTGDTNNERSDRQEDGAALDTNEIDKKAGEFIAKFKEQIRLEKTSKRSR